MEGGARIRKKLPTVERGNVFHLKDLINIRPDSLQSMFVEKFLDFSQFSRHYKRETFGPISRAKNDSTSPPSKIILEKRVTVFIIIILGYLRVGRRKYKLSKFLSSKHFFVAVFELSEDYSSHKYMIT